MLFNSIEYFLFLPILLVLLFVLKKWNRGWVVVLLASYYFYMSLKAEYVLLIIFATIVNYFAAILIEKYTKQKSKKQSKKDKKNIAKWFC